MIIYISIAACVMIIHFLNHTSASQRVKVFNKKTIKPQTSRSAYTINNIIIF